MRDFGKLLSLLIFSREEDFMKEVTYVSKRQQLQIEMGILRPVEYDELR